MKQAAFAGGLGGADPIHELKSWWKNIERYEPLLGYYPKPSKSWLIVKPKNVSLAKEIFADTDLQISTEGHQYLGGYVGSNDGNLNYMQEKVSKWIQELELLSEIARFEPQAAYTAFTAGFKHRFNYHMRVLSNFSDMLEQLDHIINTKFLPAVTEGHQLSTHERELLSLPVRLGGMGIPILSKICEKENANSKLLCESLIDDIVHQNNQHHIPPKSSKEVRNQISKDRHNHQQAMLDEIRIEMSADARLANDLAVLKGSHG